MEEESTFVRLLGNSPMIKVLDFLLVDRESDYSKKELAENSGDLIQHVEIDLALSGK